VSPPPAEANVNSAVAEEASVVRVVESLIRPFVESGTPAVFCHVLNHARSPFVSAYWLPFASRRSSTP